MIATAVLDMSNALKLSVVAEGVETLAQQAWLEARGCELADLLAAEGVIGRPDLARLQRGQGIEH